MNTNTDDNYNRESVVKLLMDNNSWQTEDGCIVRELPNDLAMVGLNRNEQDPFVRNFALCDVAERIRAQGFVVHVRKDDDQMVKTLTVGIVRAETKLGWPSGVEGSPNGHDIIASGPLYRVQGEFPQRLVLRYHTHRITPTYFIHTQFIPDGDLSFTFSKGPMTTLRRTAIAIFVRMVEATDRKLHPDNI